MSRKCVITNKKPSLGTRINRSGKAKREGGIGTHITSNTPRTFTPNLRNKRIWVPELKKFVHIKLSARALKTMDKNGVYATLKGAGLV
jgi:large subunit ribosomal protein L28